MEINKRVKNCICCWMDLLGFGTPFIESEWDLFQKSSHSSLERVMNIKLPLQAKFFKSKTLYLNDGFIFTKDYTDMKDLLVFIIGCIEHFFALNTYDKRCGYPGMRSVVTIGQRFEYDDYDHSFDYVENEIITYYPREFQMNTAFSKAYIMESSGSSKGIKGSHLYLDNTIIDKFIQMAKLDKSIKIKIENYLIYISSESLNVKNELTNDSIDVYLKLEIDEEIVNYDYKGIKTKLYKVTNMKSYWDDIDAANMLVQNKIYSKFNE